MPGVAPHCWLVTARLVFESGAPITLVLLDATNEVPVTPEFVAQLEAEQTTPEAEFVATLLANNADSLNRAAITSGIRWRRS